MNDPRTALAAASKHLDDCELLYEQGRSDNAGYLSGYVVECCLKSLLVHPQLPAAKQLGHDLLLQMDRVWQFCLALAPERRRVVLPSTPQVLRLITEWKPDLRYTRAGTVDAGTAADFLAAARSVFKAAAIEQKLDYSQYTAL